MEFEALATAPFLASYHQLAAAEKKHVKIRDVQTMLLQGPRSYTLVKVVADDGLYGIAEAYGSPGVGVTDQPDLGHAFDADQEGCLQRSHRLGHPLWTRRHG